MERRVEYMIVTQQICPRCHLPIFPVQRKDRHHAAVHDTNGNNKNLPYFTRSILASLIMHSFCHMSAPGEGRIPVELAAAYENFLTAFADLIKISVEKKCRVHMVALYKELEIIRDEIIQGKKL